LIAGEGSRPHVRAVQVDELICFHGYRHLLVSNLRYRRFLAQATNACPGCPTRG
jgi:hypothetical protein